MSRRTYQVTFAPRAIQFASPASNPGQAPTYYNRMLPGLVSGGVVLLFVKPEDIAKSGVGLNAVSFLVGYNTDYL